MEGRLPALPANIGPYGQGQQNALAYFAFSSATKKLYFIKLTPGRRFAEVEPDVGVVRQERDEAHLEGGRQPLHDDAQDGGNR